MVQMKVIGTYEADRFVHEGAIGRVMCALPLMSRTQTVQRMELPM